MHDYLLLLLYLDSIGRMTCISASPAYPFTGTVSKTVSGASCQPWSSPSNTLYTTIDLFPDSATPSVLNGSTAYPTMSTVSNYCRNPSFFYSWTDDPWCYTSSTIQPQNWELCAIPICQGKLFKIECISETFILFIHLMHVYNCTSMYIYAKLTTGCALLSGINI